MVFNPLFRLIGSLPTRQGSRRSRTVSAGSGSALALVRLLRFRGHLAGLRRLPGGRLELRHRPAHPVPRPADFRPLSRRRLAPVAPTALFNSTAGFGSQTLLRRRRIGGVPLLFPLAR